MLVIFGANGRSGLALCQEVFARKLPFRAVCRDNRDDTHIKSLIAQKKLPPNSLFHADPERPRELPPVLAGSTAVIVCTERRTTGIDGADFLYTAGEKVLVAAREAGARTLAALSVTGATRASLDSLTRSAGFFEVGVKKAGGSLIQVSCYHDEVAFAPRLKGSFAPISREDLAGVVLDRLSALKPHQELGGPETLTAEQLLNVRKNCLRPPLPAPDLIGDRLAPPAAAGLQNVASWLATRPAPPPPPEAPRRHPADFLKPIPGMPELPPVLRYEFFFQLLSDIPDADSLDWSQAQTGPLENTRIGPLTNLSSLRAKAGSETCFTGTSVYFYDDPSRQLFFWWQEKGIPGRVWDQLDVVARKKLKQQFPRDPGLAKLA